MTRYCCCIMMVVCASTLDMLSALHYIHTDKLKHYIFACQDQDDGGISDRPGNVGDVFHTFFGVCGLNLLHFDTSREEGEEGEGEYERVHAKYCLPLSVVARLGLA